MCSHQTSNFETKIQMKSISPKQLHHLYQNPARQRDLWHNISQNQNVRRFCCCCLCVWAVQKSHHQSKCFWTSKSKFHLNLKFLHFVFGMSKLLQIDSIHDLEHQNRKEIHNPSVIVTSQTQHFGAFYSNLSSKLQASKQIIIHDSCFTWREHLLESLPSHRWVLSHDIIFLLYYYIFPSTNHLIFTNLKFWHLFNNLNQFEFWVTTHELIWMNNFGGDLRIVLKNPYIIK